MISTRLVGFAYRLYWNVAKPAHTWLLSRRGHPEPDSVMNIQMVNPSKIEFHSGRDYKNKYEITGQIGEVKGGDWDQGNLRPVRGIDLDGYSGNSFNDFIYTSIRDRYCDGKSWENTDAYQFALQKVRSGEKTWHGCQNEVDIQNRCAEIDELYKKIAYSGFESYRSRIMNGQEFPRPIYQTLRREVLVDRARDGEFLFVDGIHRLSIAKILDIDHIPVQIVTRHDQF